MLTLHSKIQLTDSEVLEFHHSLQHVLAAADPVPVVGLQVGGEVGEWASPPAFPSSVEIIEDVRLPNSLFLRGRIPSPEGCNWERWMIIHRGVFCSLIDTFEPVDRLVSRSDLWNETEGWLMTELQPADPAFNFNAQVCLSPAAAEKKPKINLAAERFIRYSKFKEGTLAGLADPNEVTELRNIRIQADAFWVDQSGFALLNGKELTYSGRPLFEADQPVSIEFHMVNCIGAAIGKNEGKLFLHGGNLAHEVAVGNGQTDIEIVGLSRRSEWWNVVMGAIQKL